MQTVEATNLHLWLQKTGLDLQLSRFLRNADNGPTPCPVVHDFVACILSIPPTLLGSTPLLNRLLCPSEDLGDGCLGSQYKPLIRWICDGRDPYRLPYTFAPGCGSLDSDRILQHLDDYPNSSSYRPLICFNRPLTLYCQRFLALARYLQSKIGQGRVSMATAFLQCFDATVTESGISHSHTVLQQLLPVGTEEEVSCVVTKVPESQQPSFQWVQLHLIPDLAVLVLQYAGDDRLFELGQWRLQPSARLVANLLTLPQNPLKIVLPYTPTLDWGPLMPDATLLAPPPPLLVQQFSQILVPQLSPNQQHFIAEVLSNRTENRVSKNQGIVQYTDENGQKHFYAHTAHQGQHIHKHEAKLSSQKNFINAFNRGDGKTLTAIALCLLVPKPVGALHVILAAPKVLEQFVDQLQWVQSAHRHRFSVVRCWKDWADPTKGRDVLLLASSCLPHLTQLPKIQILVVDQTDQNVASVQRLTSKAQSVIFHATAPASVAEMMGWHAYCASTFPDAGLKRDLVLQTKTVTTSSRRRPIQKQLIPISRGTIMECFYQIVLDSLCFGPRSYTPKEETVTLQVLRAISDQQTDASALDGLPSNPSPNITDFTDLVNVMDLDASTTAKFKWLASMANTTRCPQLAAPIAPTTHPVNKLVALQSVLHQIARTAERPQVALYASDGRILRHPKLISILVNYGSVVSIVDQKPSVATKHLQTFREGRFRILLFNDPTGVDLPDVLHLIVWSFNTTDQLQEAIGGIDRFRPVDVQKTVYLLVEDRGVHQTMLQGPNGRSSLKRKRGRGDPSIDWLLLFADAILGETPNTFTWVIRRLMIALKRFVLVEQSVLDLATLCPPNLQPASNEANVKCWKPGVVALTVQGYQLHLTSTLLVYSPSKPCSRLNPLDALAVIRDSSLLSFMSLQPTACQNLFFTASSLLV